MIAVMLLASFAFSVLIVGRELGKQHPREGALLWMMAAMISLAVLAGGALTGPTL